MLTFKTSVKVFSCLAFIITGAAVAGPAINVGELNEYIQGNKNSLAKRIQNTGDSTAFVRVDVSEIVFNGEKYSEQSLDSDALIRGKGTGLMSSPARLIVPAGGAQTNRLLITGDRSRERYYRVRYVPVMPKEAGEFGVTNKELEAYKKQVKAGVNVLTGYGTIVTVLPHNPSFDTRISTAGNRLLVSNNGNGSVVVQGLKSCKGEDERECSGQTTHQVRPGSRFEQAIPAGHVLHYNLIEGLQKKALTTKQK
ncbi:hypothetical protein [Enterobacter bugandensis]|uniref:hypothetical protein n=1 Tax=Enterobacter bugandensis TaxID=881260 RepID=UPI002FCF5DC1